MKFCLTDKSPGAVHAFLGVALACLAGLLLTGCGSAGLSRDYLKDISAEKPEIATAAMNQAALAKDQKAVEPLIKRLYDEDPAIRLSAIQALQSITDQTMGYRSYESEVERTEAIKRWNVWLAEQKLKLAEEQAQQAENN